MRKNQIKKASKNDAFINKKNKTSRNEGKTHESIFNYDNEVNNELKQKRRTKLTKKVNKNQETLEETENKYIGAKELPKIDKKKLNKIKKRKQKENIKKQKELIKEEKNEEKLQNKKDKLIKKKISNRISKKQIAKINKIKKIMEIIILLIILGTSIILLLLSPIFNIKQIAVKGNSKISKETIISMLSIGENTNIFKERNQIIIDKLKQDAYIGSIKIKREIPSKLSITITERNVDYLLEFGSSYAYIDNQGYILEISNAIIEDKVKIQGYSTSIENIIPGNRICDEDLEKLNTVAQIIKVAENNNIKNIITTINIESSDNYYIYSEKEKKTIYLGNNNNIDTKMLYVKAILEKEKENEGEIFVNMDLNKKYPYFKQKV